MGENLCRWENILSGIGKLLIGVAAIAGVFVAHEAVTNNVNTNANTNSVNVNIGQLCKDVSVIKNASGNSENLKQAIEALPSQPNPDGTGLFIDGKYKGALFDKIEQAKEPEKADFFIQQFYEKSLSKYGGKVDVKPTTEHP